MKPIPPTMMRIARVIRPNKLKVPPTSTVVKPVTHTALAEMNRASMYSTTLPCCHAIGRDSNNEPSSMTNANPATRNRLGGSLFPMMEQCITLADA